MIEGIIILVSKAVLETLGCIPKTFPQVGQFLTNDDTALTGRAFAVNPDPIGLMSDGTQIPNMHEAEDSVDDKSNTVKPYANAAVASKTSYKTNKLEGSKPNQQEVAEGAIKKNNVTKAAVRQPKGECDPESDLPCSCPRRVFVEPPDQLPVPATASNRKVLEEYIKNHFGPGHSTPAKGSTGQSLPGHP